MSHGHDAHAAPKTNIVVEGKLIEQTMNRRREILSKAESEAAALSAGARNQAEQTVRDADAEVRRILSAVLRGVRGRIVGAAEMEGRKQLMIARDHALESFYEESLQRLKVVYENKEQHHTLLVKLTAEACKAIGGDKFIVKAKDSDLTVLKGGSKKITEEVSTLVGSPVHLEFSDAPIHTIGGVVVQNEDGTKTYYNTLESRVNKARAKLNVQFAKILEVVDL